jgi:hypothetical protein
MTLLAEVQVQGSHDSGRGYRPEMDGRTKQNLAYSLPAHTIQPVPPPPGRHRLVLMGLGLE